MIDRTDNTVPDGATARIEREAEMLARRALGMALNSMWSNDPRRRSAPPRLVPSDPDVAERAMFVLQQRVPPGRELSKALELLDTSAGDAA